MKVRAALLSCLLVPLLVGGACSRPAGEAGQAGGARDSPASPNLVLVLPDTLRAANLPIYGYPRDTAPFLRELADESLVFEHHLANYSETPFSVSQMQSGRFMAPLLMGYDFGRAPVRAIETEVVYPESASPTYRVDPADNLWTLRKWRLLRADPRERPGPLVLTTPWAPGRYRFGLRLDLRRTYPSRLRVQFLGGANPPLDVEASQTDADGWIDLGEQRLGNRLLLKISHARGGLFVRGLSVRRIGAEPTSPGDDRELEKRLRGLGYVHLSPLLSDPIHKLWSRAIGE